MTSIIPLLKGPTPTQVYDMVKLPVRDESLESCHDRLILTGHDHPRLYCVTVSAWFFLGDSNHPERHALRNRFDLLGALLNSHQLCSLILGLHPRQ